MCATTESTHSRLMCEGTWLLPRQQAVLSNTGTFHCVPVQEVHPGRGLLCIHVAAYAGMWESTVISGCRMQPWV